MGVALLFNVVASYAYRSTNEPTYDILLETGKNFHYQPNVKRVHTTLQSLPNNIFQALGENFTHREFIRYFGRLSTKFKEMSKQDFTWKKTHIQSPREFGLFLNAVHQNPQLPVKELCLQGLELSSSQYGELLGWLPKSTSLKTLSFTKCKFYSRAEQDQKALDEECASFAKALYECLQKNTSLEELSFIDSNLEFSRYKEPTFLPFFLPVLEQNTTLKILRLNNIFETGKRVPFEFCKWIMNNNTLETVEFSNNKIVSSNPTHVILSTLAQIKRDNPPLKFVCTGTRNCAGEYDPKASYF